MSIKTRGEIDKFLVACYATLSATLSVGPSVRRSVGRSDGPSLTKSFLRRFIAFLMALNGREETWRSKKSFQNAFEKKNKLFCPSVCLTFFESANARDLGLMFITFPFPFFFINNGRDAYLHICNYSIGICQLVNDRYDIESSFQIFLPETNWGWKL